MNFSNTAHYAISFLSRAKVEAHTRRGLLFRPFTLALKKVLMVNINILHCFKGL